MWCPKSIQSMLALIVVQLLVWPLSSNAQYRLLSNLHSSPFIIWESVICQGTDKPILR
jgi:hypothetical protein